MFQETPITPANGAGQNSEFELRRTLQLESPPGSGKVIPVEIDISGLVAKLRER